MLPTIILWLVTVVLPAAATPYQGLLSLPKNSGHNRFFDIQVRKWTCIALCLVADIGYQAHRGGRANTIESTLPSFAWYMVVDLLVLLFY